MAISPNSRWLVSGGGSIWDLKHDNPASTHRDLIFYADQISFSKDSRWLVTHRHTSAEVRDLTAENPSSSKIVLEGGTRLSAVGIAPDGSLAVTGSEDGEVRLYDLDIDSLVERARRLAGRGLTDAER